MAARRQLPLPDGVAPQRRAPPALPREDSESPPPPVPSRPIPGKPAPAVPNSSRPLPTTPSTPKQPPQKTQTSDSDDDDDSFDSDSSTESYEDMSGQDAVAPETKPPVLPNRGYHHITEQKRPPPPPPSRLKPVSVPEPEENEYDEGDAGEIYDEAANGGSDHEEQETYDDMDVGEAVEEPQEEYADCEVQEEEEEVEQQSYDDFEAVAQDTYEVEETQEEYQECEVGEPVREDLYQVADNESPSPPPPIAPAPALPPPRPKQKKDDTAAPPPPRESAKKPIKGAGPMPGMPAIGMGDIQNIKDRLKKVTMHTDEKIEKKEPKVYTDSNELKQTFNFFKQKEKEVDSSGEEPQSAKIDTSLTKPIPPKPNREIPRVALKPVVTINNVNRPATRDTEEEKSEPTNFLSQVKLRSIHKEEGNKGSEESSINKPPRQNDQPKQAIKPPRQNEPPKPAVRPPRQDNTPKLLQTSDSVFNKLDENNIQNDAGRILPSEHSMTKTPIPPPKPREKKSFLHAYVEEHPEIKDERLPPRLNQFWPVSALAKGNKPEITPKPPGLNLKKSAPVKDNKTNSPVLPTRPSDKSTSLHRNTSDSLPSPRDADLPPPPPPVSDIPPVHSRDLPPPPPSGNDTPQLPPPRGKDGYTKVAVSHPEENNNEDGEEPEDFYDDALSFNDPLLKESWYFGDIERTVGNDKLKKLNMNGGYLLRKSTKGGDKQPFTLMVIYSNHVYNLKIRERRDGRVALGEEKPDEMSFLSVADLIKHHQTNDVILVHRDGKQDTTMLIKSPAK